VTGTLGLFSLVDLFQLLASSSRSGRLLVEHPRGVARVYFEKGKVVHADFESFKGEEAVYELFSDERGSFEFSLGLPAPEQTISGSTENLVLESIRKLDESRRDNPNQTRSLDDGAVPSFTDKAPDAGNLTLYANEVTVLRVIDGRRDLKQIAKLTKLDLEEVKRVVSRLMRVGAITVRGKKPRVARLVAQLARRPLPPNVVGIDTKIVDNWRRVVGYKPNRVACRRPNGKIDTFDLEAHDDVGAYILMSRDTLFTANLAANTALLVKPLPSEDNRS